MSVAEGDKLMKKGDSKTTVTFLRWSPDWESALPYFEKAAQEYRRAGDKARAKVAYEKCSLAQEKQNSPWHAAKCLETAGSLAKESGAEPQEICDFFRRANGLYCEAGRAQSGADALCRGAKALEPIAVESAVAMYMDACEQYENEEKEHYAGDAFRSAVAAQLAANLYPDAASTLLRFGVICEKMGSHNSQCKAYLGAVVVYLYAQDAAAAQNCLNDLLTVNQFRGSEEANTAEDLLDAYCTGDVESVQSFIKRTHTFEHLDNAIARLVRKLPVGDVEKMSQQLKGKVLKLDSSEWQISRPANPGPPKPLGAEYPPTSQMGAMRLEPLEMYPQPQPLPADVATPSTAAAATAVTPPAPDADNATSSETASSLPTEVDGTQQGPGGSAEEDEEDLC